MNIVVCVAALDNFDTCSILYVEENKTYSSSRLCFFLRGAGFCRPVDARITKCSILAGK